MSLIEKLFPPSDSTIQKRYIQAGASFGDAVSYLFMGECRGFEELFNYWADLEQKYADRGYRTISLDRFIELGGYGNPIGEVIGKKREKGEEPIFHAQIYKKEFLGKIKPAVDLNQMMKGGKAQYGEYVLPSTEQNKK